MTTIRGFSAANALPYIRKTQRIANTPHQLTAVIDKLHSERAVAAQETIGAGLDSFLGSHFAIFLQNGVPLNLSTILSFL